MAGTLAADIEAALHADELAFADFNRLPPSHRQEYLRWIDDAKMPQTRARRVAGMIERLKGSR